MRSWRLWTLTYNRDYVFSQGPYGLDRSINMCCCWLGCGYPQTLSAGILLCLPAVSGSISLCLQAVYNTAWRRHFTLGISLCLQAIYALSGDSILLYVQAVYYYFRRQWFALSASTTVCYSFLRQYITLSAGSILLSCRRYVTLFAGGILFYIILSADSMLLCVQVIYYSVCRR